ncbi:MAG: protein-tyrosine-phosphatase, partial [Gammaproteobacteria bacterium]|nr:protein-tyrosine-phosphatase [Gammaproteobacteria bacterium]
MDSMLLPLNGAKNVRDLGGYLTKDNQIVRPRLVYRADSLAALDDT